MEAAAHYWKQYHPGLLFIHLDNVDHAGHESGWLSKAYYQAVSEADGYVGRILDMVDDDPARDSTFILITSDHGGTRHGHGKNSLVEIQIPWMLLGPDVAPGQIRAAVNTYDTAVNLAWLFRLEPPQCWTGRPVLAAFRPAAILARGSAALTNARQAACAPPNPLSDELAAALAGLHALQGTQRDGGWVYTKLRARPRFTRGGMLKCPVIQSQSEEQSESQRTRSPTRTKKAAMLW